MDVHAQESLNGTRMSWNVWPSTRLEAAKMVVPLGCLYTPLKAVDGLSLVEYEPVVCRSRDCGAVLNPYCFVDFHSKTWGCPFCLQRNAFPRHYAEHITEANLPAELHQACTTMEYVIPQSVCQPPVFLIVLDVTLVEEELEQAKDSVQQCLAVMPQDALVGFVTFGALVYVHELRQSALPKAYAFRAGKEAGAEQVAARLGLQRSGGAAPEAAGRFLAPVVECEFALSSLLDDLARDAWPQGAGAFAELAAPSEPLCSRPLRAGTAPEPRDIGSGGDLVSRRGVHWQGGGARGGQEEVGQERRVGRGLGSHCFCSGKIC